MLSFLKIRRLIVYDGRETVKGKKSGSVEEESFEFGFFYFYIQGNKRRDGMEIDTELLPKHKGLRIATKLECS